MLEPTWNVTYPEEEVVSPTSDLDLCLLTLNPREPTRELTLSVTRRLTQPLTSNDPTWRRKLCLDSELKIATPLFSIKRNKFPRRSLKESK